MLIHKEEIHKGALPNFLSLIYGTTGLSTHSWIKKILELSSKMKTLLNVLQSSTVFHSEMFYKVLQYSIAKLLNIQEIFRLFFFLLDYSIHIIEQYNNLKYIKLQEKQITFKQEYIM